MKVLILSCNTGEGHNAAGRAMMEKLQSCGHEAVMLDSMMLSGKMTSKIVGGAYVKIAKNTPRLFQFIYKVGEWITSPKRKSPVYLANSLVARHLRDYLNEQEEPFDFILMPHLFPSEMVTYLKRKGQLKQKTIGIMTDYTCIPFWEETELDYYVTPCKDLESVYTGKGLPKEKLLPMGIPVGMQFAKKKEKAEAKQALGLPEDKPMYLVMAGSMGFGKIKKLTKELYNACTDGQTIAVICGNNKGLKRYLDAWFKGKETVQIIGFTRQVSDYMDACDVIFTKPGGLSSTESAAKMIPLIHTAPIPGCETCNLEFFTSRGLSLSAPNVEQQLTQWKRIVEDEGLQESMREAQKTHINAQASEDIYQFMCKLAAEPEFEEVPVREPELVTVS